MKRIWAIWTLGACLGGMTAGVSAQDAPPPAPEVDRLLRDSKAPARFKNHKPEFDIRPQTYSFKAGGRAFQETYFAIFDGPRFVALCDPNGNQMAIVAPNPDLAPTKLDLASPLSAGPNIGTRLRPQIRLSGRPLEIDQQDCHFSKEEAAAVVVFRQEWSQPKKGHSTSIFRFRCDAVRGYVVDISTQVSLPPESSKKNSTGEIIGVLAMQPARMDNPWPNACEYDRTVCTYGSGTGYSGWWNNFATATRVHGRDDFLPLRAGGFLTYLGGKEAWIPAISYPDTADGTPLHRIDPVTLEQQCYQMRPASEPGQKTEPLLTRMEFTPLPPEAAGQLSQRANMGKWESQRAVMLRLGHLEDLEDQPISLGSGVRALVSPAYLLSTKEAHSGKNSLVVLGTTANRQATAKPQVSAPAIALEANSRYRISIWAKSASGVTDGLISIALHSSADLQDEGARRLRTAPAKAGEGWKELTLEFETGPSSAFGDLRLQAIGNGAVYFDDFSFTKVKQ